MCLLIVCSRVVDGFPLVVAANRDERLDRPAEAIALLQAADPAVLGGHDLLAGGSWLAVNEHGVVAGLTNQRSPGGRDPNRHSRGELPILLADEPSVRSALGALVETVSAPAYNPAWILVGDRSSAGYANLNGSYGLTTEFLDEGIHVLENQALGVPSGKVDRAIEILGDPTHLAPKALIAQLVTVLSDHDNGAVGSEQQHSPCCVHGESYGTRSSMIVLVPVEERPIRVLVANGHPCTTSFIEETSRWPM
jgi:uncharacterized protein with NRDE domain